MKKVFILNIVLLLLVSMVGINHAQETWKQLVIGTSGTGGTYYPLGGGMAAIINKYIPGVNATAIPSGGTIENIRAVTKGTQHLGMGMPQQVFEAYKGIGPFKGKPHEELRALLNHCSTEIQIYVAEESPINSLYDLKGKNYRVTVGPPGSGLESFAKYLLGLYGVTYNDIREQFLTQTEATEAMKDGNIDMAFVSMGTPGPTLIDLFQARKIRFIDIEPEIIARIRKEMPAFLPSTVPAGTYPRMAKPHHTVTNRAILFARKAFPEDLAYEFLKQFFDHKPEIDAMHAHFKIITLQTAIEGMLIPLHSGAMRYYKEKGIVK